MATSRGGGSGGQYVAAVRRGPRAAGYGLCARPDGNINILISIWGKHCGTPESDIDSLRPQLHTGPTRRITKVKRTVHSN